MAKAEFNQYDQIGIGYERKRRPDPRIARAMLDQLGHSNSVVNVGAGTGSYEPRDRFVLAVEPSITMIQQRPIDAAPVVQARAEQLPFPDGSFDAALAVLTIHHWTNRQAGLREMGRVSRERVVIFTWDPDADSSWLGDYFGHLIEADRKRFPSLPAIQSLLGEIQITKVNIPEDCIDGFMGAYWRRPEQYLNPQVRAAISAFASSESQLALSRLTEDINNGNWEKKYRDRLPHGEIDLGYRLISADIQHQ